MDNAEVTKLTKLAQLLDNPRQHIQQRSYILVSVVFTQRKPETTMR